MALVYIIAGAPWGPVKLGWADHAGALLDRVGSAPAHVEDIGNRSAEQVIAEACRNLPAADPMGLIATSTQKAAKAVRDAVFAVPAMVVAVKLPETATRAENEGYASGAGSEMRDQSEPGSSERPANTSEGCRSFEPGVRDIRLGLKMSQPAFAKAFGLGVATVRDWEQGRTEPDSAARTLLTVISRRPDAVREALAGYGASV